MLIKAASLITAIFLAIQPPIHPASVNTVEVYVGDGSAASCTEAALNTAIDKVNATNDAVRIRFNCGASPVKINITSAKQITGHHVGVLEGAGLITLDASKRSRHFLIQYQGELIINDMTLINGQSSDEGGSIQVGGSGILNVNNVSFTNNTSLFTSNSYGYCGGGGAIAFLGSYPSSIVSSHFTGNNAKSGGAVYILTSNISILNSDFSQNTAQHTLINSKDCGGGGAIFIDGAKNGGKIDLLNNTYSGNQTNMAGGAVFAHLYGADQLTIDHSSFAQNQAVFQPSPSGDPASGNGGGIWFDGHNTNDAPIFNGTVSLTNSTFSKNHADYKGGAIYAWDAPINLTNLTIDSNTAQNSYPGVTAYAHGDGGGIAIGTTSIKPTTKITNVTLRNNTAGHSGDAIEALNGAAPSIQLANTILVNTLAKGSSGTGIMCSSSFNDLGGNIQYQANASGANCSGKILVANPDTDTLKDNGGPTLTVAILRDSPAKDHAVASACPGADQRGYKRVDNCDSGAFEFGAEPFRPSHWAYLPFVKR
jgi:predicted outer membrane repeat protein